MASSQNHMPYNTVLGDEQTKTIHIIDICSWPPSKMPLYAEWGDSIEFKINGKETYDVYPVYKEGDDYYRINDSSPLIDINNSTPTNDRLMLLSLALNRNENESESEIDLYFCVFASSRRRSLLTTSKCPGRNCESNRVRIRKRGRSITLADERKNEKYILKKGDSIQLEVLSEHGIAYRIEEKKYCPVSGGLYTVEQTSDIASSKILYTKTFDEYGISFLFRFTDTNQLHDITTCVVTTRHEAQIKKIKITHNNIQPNKLSIEHNDWILFEWDTGCVGTGIRIEQLYIAGNKPKPITVCISFENTRN